MSWSLGRLRLRANVMDARTAAIPPSSRRAPPAWMPRLVTDSRELSFLRLNVRRLNGDKGRGCGPQEKSGQKRSTRNLVFV
jgi:hypothetical protein